MSRIGSGIKRLSNFYAGVIVGALLVALGEQTKAFLNLMWAYATHPTPARFGIIACEIALVWMIRRHWPRQTRAA